MTPDLTALTEALQDLNRAISDLRTMGFAVKLDSKTSVLFADDDITARVHSLPIIVYAPAKAQSV